MSEAWLLLLFDAKHRKREVKLCCAVAEFGALYSLQRSYYNAIAELLGTLHEGYISGRGSNLAHGPHTATKYTAATLKRI